MDTHCIRASGVSVFAVFVGYVEKHHVGESVPCASDRYSEDIFSYASIREAFLNTHRYGVGGVGERTTKIRPFQFSKRANLFFVFLGILPAYSPFRRLLHLPHLPTSSPLSC